MKLIYLPIVFSSSKSILKRKGSQDLPASDYYAIYRQTKKTSLQQTNAPCKQCVKRSHILGVALRSRSCPKKRSATPTSLLWKKKEWHSFIALFKKKTNLSKKLQTREFFLTPLIIRDYYTCELTSSNLSHTR